MRTPFRTNAELPGWFRSGVIFGVAGLLTILEYRRALRKSQLEPKARREIRNLVIAATAGLVMQFCERPPSVWLARKVNARAWGIAPVLSRSPLAQTLLSVALLDYGLYIWHVLTHKVPFLWRFHLVHHIDLDLDASTALRFHFGEMVLSVPWRLAQIFVVGASPLALSIWQTFLFASILFHHSNVKLPWKSEQILRFLITTPRLHGIHHEADQARTNSNWSSGFALWDMLHGTQLWDATTGEIGVPAYQEQEDVKLACCLILPFKQQRADWVSESGQHS